MSREEMFEKAGMTTNIVDHLEDSNDIIFPDNYTADEIVGTLSIACLFSNPAKQKHGSVYIHGGVLHPNNRTLIRTMCVAGGFTEVRFTSQTDEAIGQPPKHLGEIIYVMPVLTIIGGSLIFIDEPRDSDAMIHPMFVHVLQDMLEFVLSAYGRVSVTVNCMSVRWRAPVLYLLRKFVMNSDDKRPICQLEILARVGDNPLTWMENVYIKTIVHRDLAVLVVDGQITNMDSMCLWMKAASSNLSRLRVDNVRDDVTKLCEAIKSTGLVEVFLGKVMKGTAVDPFTEVSSYRKFTFTEMN